MRKSKSNPAKYSRNYRKISQRRMTSHDVINVDTITNNTNDNGELTNHNNHHDDSNQRKVDKEEVEMERLRNLLRSSTKYLLNSTSTTNNENPDTIHTNSKHNHESNTSGKSHEMNIPNYHNSNHESINSNTLSSILDTNNNNNNDNDDIEYKTDNTELIIIPSSSTKKRNSTTTTPKIQLTPLELKIAKQQHKNNLRKLKQLEQRHVQKKQRTTLYQTLSQHSISNQELALMEKSCNVGKKISKKEMLKRLIQKERMGIVLTKEEKGLLYNVVEIQSGVGDEEMKEKKKEGDSFIDPDGIMNTEYFNDNSNYHNHEKKLETNHNMNCDADDGNVVPLEFPSSSSSKKRKRNKGKQDATNITMDDSTSSNFIKNDKEDEHPNHEMEIVQNKNAAIGKIDQSESFTPPNNNTQENHMTVHNKSNDRNVSPTQDGISESSKTPPPLSSFSLAAQMMAGLSQLKKTTSQIQKQENEKRETEELNQKHEKDKMEPQSTHSIYIPPKPTPLPRTVPLSLQPYSEEQQSSKTNWRVLDVNRPNDIQTMRYDLPISAMEFEIMDSVRNHLVTILCSETGSGKSTQVPQFLYESGMTLGKARKKGQDDKLLIGITQPRRVAAISTAKRVCYEMGHSNDKGQSIRSVEGKGNLVAYQTRYETAGMGEKTRIKFMTDGILLQEIKNDLLLRKYAVIILDEAHERNLNTDVLLGLLSAALPLRQKAAEEGSLPPLKLIIMSATLRVTDFTENKRLFRYSPPNLVQVPGRTFPVTLHHSKVTELDDYEKVAFQKVVKIHRRLPRGGILVFLTGKQEITKMVNQLRKVLGQDRNITDFSETIDETTIEVGASENDNLCPRDMDDEEVDGDIFQTREENGGADWPDIDAIKSIEENLGAISTDVDDNIPKKVRILPLHSMLSPNEQAKVFAPVPEDTRLIVIATNIAETSLTIPGISYVVDTGRLKCRNYHAKTGMASYDIMWISKAAADQRAGRAGRTGPGHCYRLYSSSVYARQLDPFDLPEVLSRPLEDVVLAMKAMNISNISEFPFPTPPDASQLNAAISLLANIGCIDTSQVEKSGGDGVITDLGSAVAKLPLGVRYGKMLLVSAKANILDFGIALVSVLSESNPFIFQNVETEADGEEAESDEALDEVDTNTQMKNETEKRRSQGRKWHHSGGDILASMLAAGAYAYAGRGSGGHSEAVACKRFCEENKVHPVIMKRIHKMRQYLSKLAKQRLSHLNSIASKTGGVLCTMAPPTKLQENLLKQTIVSGLLDNVARRHFETDSTTPRSAYFSCRSSIKEPLFIDKRSSLFSRDWRQLPEWICYDTIIRKTTNDGNLIFIMKNVTPLDPTWLGVLAHDSKLLHHGEPLNVPSPKFDLEKDAIMCAMTTKYGDHGWIIPPVYISMTKALERSKENSAVMADDSYRWFARYLLEGKVIKELKGLSDLLNDDPVIITRKKPVNKVVLLVSALASHKIDSVSSLCNHWREKDNKFLFKHLKSWVRKECVEEAKNIWIKTVTECIKIHDR